MCLHVWWGGGNDTESSEDSSSVSSISDGEDALAHLLQEKKFAEGLLRDSVEEVFSTIQSKRGWREWDPVGAHLAIPFETYLTDDKEDDEELLRMLPRNKRSRPKEVHLLAVVICPIQKGKFGVEVPFFYNSNHHFNAFEQCTKFAVFSLLAKDACCEDPVFACGLEDVIDAVSEVQEDDEDDDSSKGSTEENVSSLSETPIASLKLKKALARRHGQMKRKRLKISRMGRAPKKTRHESDDSSFKASSSDEEEEEFAAERVKTPKHVNTSSAGRTLRPPGGSQCRGRPRKLVLERPGRKKRTRRSAGTFTAATRQHQFDNTDDEDGEGNGDPVVESSDEEVSAEVVWNTRDAENLPPSNDNPCFEPSRAGNLNERGRSGTIYLDT